MAATLEGFAGLTDQQLIDAMPKLIGLDLSTVTARDPLQRITPLGVVLDEHPATTVARGAGQPVDLLIGHNTDEGKSVSVTQWCGGDDNPATADRRSRVRRLDPDRLLSVYAGCIPPPRQASCARSSWGGGRSAPVAELWPTVIRRAGHLTYAYAFGWPSPALDGQLGATHIVELPFVFDNLLPTPPGHRRAARHIRPRRRWPPEYIAPGSTSSPPVHPAGLDTAPTGAPRSSSTTTGPL